MYGWSDCTLAASEAFANFLSAHFTGYAIMSCLLLFADDWIVTGWNPILQTAALDAYVVLWMDTRLAAVERLGEISKGKVKRNVDGSFGEFQQRSSKWGRYYLERVLARGPLRLLIYLYSKTVARKANKIVPQYQSTNRERFGSIGVEYWIPVSRPVTACATVRATNRV